MKTLFSLLLALAPMSASIVLLAQDQPIWAPVPWVLFLLGGWSFWLWETSCE